MTAKKPRATALLKTAAPPMRSCAELLQDLLDTQAVLDADQLQISALDAEIRKARQAREKICGSRRYLEACAAQSRLKAQLAHALVLQSRETVAAAEIAAGWFVTHSTREGPNPWLCALAGMKGWSDRDFQMAGCAAFIAAWRFTGDDLIEDGPCAGQRTALVREHRIWRLVAPAEPLDFFQQGYSLSPDPENGALNRTQAPGGACGAWSDTYWWWKALREQTQPRELNTLAAYTW